MSHSEKDGTTHNAQPVYPYSVNDQSIFRQVVVLVVT